MWQDSLDRFNALKGDILKQINSNENEINQKDVKILQLEKQLTQNSFDNKKLLQEASALFPDITQLSIAHHEFAMKKNTLMPATVVLFRSTKRLKAEDEEKLKNWLNTRLLVKDVQVFRAQ